MNRRVLTVGTVVGLPLVLVLLLNIERDPRTIPSPIIGRPAPAFALPTVEGGVPVSLASLRGKPVVVNFWATWCVPCFEEHAVLVDGAQRHAGEVQFLGVVYEDEPARIMDFLTRQGGGYPSLVDDGSRTAIAYGVFGVPESFFIDAQGVVTGKHTGPLTREALESQLVKARQPRP